MYTLIKASTISELYFKVGCPIFTSYFFCFEAKHKSFLETKNFRGCPFNVCSIFTVMCRLEPSCVPAVYLMCAVGWVDFALFLEFHQKSRVGGSPRYNKGNYQMFLTLVKKPVRASPQKVHNFK